MALFRYVCGLRATQRFTGPLLSMSPTTVNELPFRNSSEIVQPNIL